MIRLAVAHGGSGGVVVGRWWCCRRLCWSLVLDGGVPYFPMKCMPVLLGGRMWEGRVNVFWVDRCAVAAVQRGVFCGPVDRLGLHGLGHTDSRYSKVTFGEGFG